MVLALSGKGKFIVTAAIVFAISGLRLHAQEDPPYRVARLNYVQGNVSMDPAGLNDWAPAIVNHPFSIGDYLYADQGSRAELHMDQAVVRMGQQTSFGFLNLDDSNVQIKLAGGDMYFRLHNFAPDQTFEVDTPNVAVSLLRDGIYRMRVDPNGNMTFVVVRQGGAVITGGGQSFNLDSGNSALLTGTDNLSYDVENAPDPDDFDSWCYTRDAHEARLRSARYLPPTVIGYEDLDDYGDWQQAGDYGPVWYPRQLDAGWAPYHDGHWAWVEPWGWTWIDDAPWGFAPFHYGRWVYVSNRWGWAPGPIAVGYRGPVVRPYYAPALVAWFGGAHWGVGVSVGSAPSVGWVSLGWGEVYTPSYTCSQRYFTNVNVSNTRIVNTVNITNVYNTVYVNKTVYNQTFVNVNAPGAVVAMNQQAFAGGQPVRQAAVTVSAANVGQLRQSAVVAPAVVPTRQAVAPSLGRPAPHPPAQMLQRQVVAKATPPAPPAPFAARQQFLQQNVGQPHNYAVMHQTVAPQNRPVAAVRQVAAAPAPVQVHPGQKSGNQTAFQNRPAPGAPGRPNAEPQAHFPQSTATPANQPRPVSTPPPGVAPRQPSPETRPVPAPQPPAARPEVANPPANPPTRPQPSAPPERPVERTQPAPAARPAEPPPNPEARRPAPPPATATRPPAPAAHPPATETATHPAAHDQHSTETKKDEKKEEKKDQKKEDKRTQP